MAEIYHLDQRPAQTRSNGGRLRQAITNADTLVAKIRDGILEGVIKPGDFLGSERDIAENYNVSRNTAREALRSLAALGAVEISLGVKGGATIASGDAEAIGETLAIQHRLLGVSEDEVLEVQAVLEGLAAERAAEHATPEDVEQLESLLNEGETLRNNPAAFSDSSLTFHMAIAEAAHSQGLMMQLRSIRYFIWPPNNQVPKPNVAENVLKAHRKLLELIKNQDAAGAHEFMRDHIEHIRNQHRILRGGGDPEDAACC